MCVQTIIEEVAQIPWEIVPKDENLRESPPEDIQAEIDEATYLLNNPNDNKGETINTIFRAAIRDSLEIDALAVVKGFSLNSYVQHPAGGFELKPRGERQLVELFARDGGSFLKETDVNGIEYRYWQYSYLHPAVAPIEFDVNEIVYGMRYPRSYSVYGWSELQSMETVLNSLINSAFTNANMFQEYSIPSGVLSFTGSEEDEQRLRERLRTEVKGHFHRVMVLNKDAKFSPLAYTNRDLEFIQGQQWFAKIVWAIYKLTPSELGFTDDIRATGKAMSAQGLVQTRKAILPVLRLLEQWMNNQVINEISDRIVFAFKYVDKQQEMADDQVDMQKVNDGLMLFNEYRAKKKMGPPVWYGEQPLQITLAQMKAQMPKMFPSGSSGGGEPGSTPGAPKIPLSAEGQALIQSFKAWGGVPNEGYDFAAGSLGGNDKYAAPVLTYDNRTGQVKVLPQATMTIPGRRYLTRDGQIFTVPVRKPLPEKPTNPRSKVIHRPPTQKGFKDKAAAVVKQYAKPTREPFIGPYEADRKPAHRTPSMVGGDPNETFRNGDLVAGEDPEQARRSRDAVGPKPEGPRARRRLGTDQDYPMGALGYRPDEPPARGDVGEGQTPEGIVQARVGREYERPGKPFGPMDNTQPHRTGPKESYRGGPGNVGGKFPRRKGGRIRKIGHPSTEPGPASTGEVYRETPKGKNKIDLHRGGAGVHRWERDETNVPVAMAGEEPNQTHVDPTLIRKPYPGRHRKVTGGGGGDVETRLVPTRAGSPKIVDGSVPHDDRIYMEAYRKEFLKERKAHPKMPGEIIDKTIRARLAKKGMSPITVLPDGSAFFTTTIPTSKREVEKFKKERAKREKTDPLLRLAKGERPNQPDNSPTAPLAQPRENMDPAGGAGTEQAPRLRPTPRIRRGPKYPRDVPPIQDDTVRANEGGAGGMRSTAPSGAKFVLQDKRGRPPGEDTGSLGPDHRETLGHVEQNLSKVRDGVKRSAWAPGKKQVNAYTYKEQWKGGRLEPSLAHPPTKRDIQAARKEQASVKAIGPRHGHPDVYHGSIAAEKGLAQRLASLLKAYRAGKISKNQFRTLGLAAVDKNLATMKAIHLRQASRIRGKAVTEPSPELVHRWAIIRKTAAEDIDRIIGDAKQVG